MKLTKEIVNARFDWLKSVVDKNGHARIEELRDLALIGLQADGWMPIETAPKVCDPSVLLSNKKTGDVWMDFWADEDCWNNAAEYELPKPTHWRPLPAPPQAATEQP